MNFSDDGDATGMYSPRPDGEGQPGFDAGPSAKNDWRHEKFDMADIRLDDNVVGGGYMGGGDMGGGFGGPASLPVELTELFAVVSNFEPPPLDLTPHVKPFLPGLIPSIGAIDAFVKIPRPDGEQDPLGLTVLDEPTIGCSNPQILRMQLREQFGVVGGNEGDGFIGSIAKPVQNPKALVSFLESYDEISRNRAAPNMTYTFKVPDIEELMEHWPDEMESALASVPLPAADLDLTLEEYAKVVCSLLDVPVKGNLVESMHLLFTLYQRFKECNYFTNAGSRGSSPNT